MRVRAVSLICAAVQPPVARDDAVLHGCPICTTAPLANSQPLLFIASPQGECDQPPQYYGLGRGWHPLHSKVWGAPPGYGD